jgi:UDP-N-acetylmuramoylalanine--D-glutamate ligase
MAICEVSSFQAEQLGHFSADAVIWTNFAEDHLERHPGMEAYFAAKWELVTRTRSSRLFAGSSVAAVRLAVRTLDPTRLVCRTEGQRGTRVSEGTPFESYPQTGEFHPRGRLVALEGLDETVLYGAAKGFRLGRHRLSRVAVIDGVAYWNDSKATNFHAVEAALGGLEGPVVLIAGGRSKGGDLAAFVRRIAPRVACAVLDR